MASRQFFLGWGIVFLTVSSQILSAPLRVERAMKSKSTQVRGYFTDFGITFPPRELLFRVYKLDGLLEVWAKGNVGSFQKIKQYNLCDISGRLGPKRREGDKQIPEGFYTVNGLNPFSKYHLSLKLNYPNESDLLRGKGDLGGDIFIHGGCSTVGCLAITDDAISEVYLMVQETLSKSAHPVSVHIFPTLLTDLRFNFLKARFSQDATLVQFWQSLKPGYDVFEQEKELPDISVDRMGNYRVKRVARLTSQ